MTPHSRALLLVFSFWLCGNLSAVSLNKALSSTNTDATPHPAGSPAWTSWHTKMYMTAPTILSLSKKRLNSKETTQGPVTALPVLLSASKAPWTKSSYQTPLDIQRDEEEPQTEAFDEDNISMKGKTALSFETHSLTTLKPDLRPQTWNTESITPIAYAETYTSKISTKQGTYQTPWKSSGTVQTPYARGTLDGTNLPGGLIDYVWPSEKTRDLTDAPTGDDWRDTSTIPNCNLIGPGICQSPDSLRSRANNTTLSTPPPLTETTPPGIITPPLDALTPPLLVPLLTDWNAAMATWGLAWELQVYGLGCVFSLVAVLSTLSLMCLPLRWPSGCAYFSLLHLLQLLTGSSRALWLLYDPYGQKDRIPAGIARLLHEAAYPCLVASFGLLLLLLTARSCTQLLSQNTLQRSSCLLGALVLLHLAVVMASVAILQLFPTLPVVPLIPPAAFLLMSVLLSMTYLLLYCCARADAKHIYRLSENSPERPACHASRCPFTEARMWERAARAGVFTALFLLACGGLRLYAMLHAGGLTNGVMVGLMPWPWLAFQLSCRVCEAGVCLTIALIITHPLLCCGVPLTKPSGFGLLFKKSQNESSESAKATVLSNRCGWSLRPAEKFGLCEGMARRESESVPLYTLVELPHSESQGLDFHYPSSPQHKLSTQTANKGRPSYSPSFASLDADSTADLRPPSPIDLRRSIDEALNSEALFQHSLFGSSQLSLSTRGLPDGQPCRGNLTTEPILYRTASCGDVDPAMVLTRPRQGSTIVERPSVSGGQDSNYCRRFNSEQQSQNSLHRGSQPGLQYQRRYKTLGSTSSKGSLNVETHSHADELAVQAEFIHVCRQIDALSVSSDTIEL
ncbi:Proline-rich transmembrane protein 4 [Triplophysa tibetana]|uniref:Proline-rich transmembrane protein 4 n=1 Tax=Triplophysa tibetana TaxID=1572043 RepID=A0A5A9P319_9TELE|nr:Proline-rich transmembrane protein 4 [Triplophysa tibetana]